MNKKIILAATITLLSSNNGYAYTQEVIYNSESDIPKRFYIGVGYGMICPWDSNMDITGLPSYLKDVVPTVINLFKSESQKESTELKVVPNELPYTKGLSHNLKVGYISNSFGRWEIEGMSSLQGINKTAGISHLGSLALMGNLYYDFLNTSKLDLFVGAGLGRAWHYNLIGIGKVVAPNSNWAAHGKAGVSFHLAENIDLVASYTAFTLLNKEAFNFENTVVTKVVDKAKKAMGQGEDAANAETKSETKPKPVTYKTHGPRIELHVKF